MDMVSMDVVLLFLHFFILQNKLILAFLYLTHFDETKVLEKGVLEIRH